MMSCEIITAMNNKGGRKDFEKYVAEALGDLLNNDSAAEEDQPWKVE